MSDDTLQAVRFSIEAGRLVAGGVERELRRAAFEAGLTIGVERHGGFFEVLLLVTIEGDLSTLRAFWPAVQRWAKMWESEE